MRFKTLTLAAAAAVVLSAGAAKAEGDAAAGEALFKKRCAVCHAVEAGKNKVGPSLAGVVGAAAGHVESYKYSKAIMDSGLTWDEATLDEYLTDPRGVVKGTKMAFPGLKKEEERADVIAYLSTLGQ